MSVHWMWCTQYGLTAARHLCAALFVSVLGWDPPEAWTSPRTLFGSSLGAYTLRRFWAVYWHRLHVAPFSAYDLRRMRRTHGGYERVPSESPRFYVQRASARVSGPAGVGLKRSRSLVPGRRSPRAAAVPLGLSGKASKYGIPTFEKKAESVFAISGAGWTAGPGGGGGGGGGVVAKTRDDKGDTRHTLDVTAAMPRGQFEMLVALWCCHVWEFVTTNAPKTHEGMDGVARKMKLAKEFGWTPGNTGPAGGTMGFGVGGGGGM
ncbi:hypothetical protein GGTG_11711 [Gaeumannomyces tritici R3-111a-1]|uniref:Wax synthase domain-containing protein n=1 Tax=Gaeumannomyces tritici (strain R3-111a-1) TaxID=644352 RepID=J3PDY8_GAET3|nr:hypothetical protein GGTG_11711 [Gaeumannomyces tritici R3-111a-1]EJT70688.1 hypothetical protein GGTG_11711 [Gaeumannomyces tritici R3-111a-1]